MQARIVLIFVLVGLSLGLGCGGADDDTAGRSIVAAFYPLAFAAEQLDPAANVTNLTPAGAEPHDLELTARDVQRVRDADLVLYLRGFMPALDDAVDGQANALDVLAGADALDDGSLDPHVWLDPERYAAMVESIADALGTADAAVAPVAELEQLDRDFRRGLASCERRTIVTSHAAFGYLAAAYELEQISLTGLTPEAEPSARAIERLVAEVEDSRATTVFFEPLVSPELAETVAREAGVATAVLNPLEGLSDDELAAGVDYFELMRDNLDALQTGLGCS